MRLLRLLGVFSLPYGGRCGGGCEGREEAVRCGGGCEGMVMGCGLCFSLCSLFSPCALCQQFGSTVGTKIQNKSTRSK